ncbi:MAG TPA: Gfo/Idh/MocA family oxidoreductase, partial [Chitinophagaceae bacterium]|nr:Gfo/Idh/MocA family oxidoreductase [Chitinophagaceae bacterium]
MKKISGTVNWGIIGCGDVCEVKSGPAYNKVVNSKLVAVMRRDAGKARDFAQRHGVPKYYTDALELINDKEVNAIYIATPPSSHEAYLEMALKAGKPVYVEKPVTVNSASVQRMMEMERQYNTKVSVAHYRRGLPLFIKIKQLVSDGAVGKVKLILLRTLQPPVSELITQTDDNWRINPEISGGGLFHDLSPHQLDIMYWIFGTPQQVYVQVANQGKLYNAP